MLCKIKDYFGHEISDFVAVPDSMMSPVLRAVQTADDRRYIQVVHEAQAIAVAAGLTVAGRMPVICVESSGVRAGCESIARLSGLHGINFLLFVSGRGEFGDPNWWAQEHASHLSTLLEMLHVKVQYVSHADEVRPAIDRGVAVVKTRMASAAIICRADALLEMANEIARRDSRD
jgi:sulfopyruvate decarboxylase subunit alpha